MSHPYPRGCSLTSRSSRRARQQEAAGRSRSKLRQWWIIGFILGATMINYPFLQVFNRPTFLWGFPLLFLYLFVGWFASISVIGLYAWSLKRLPPDEEE